MYVTWVPHLLVDSFLELLRPPMRQKPCKMTVVLANGDSKTTLDITHYVEIDCTCDDADGKNHLKQKVPTLICDKLSTDAILGLPTIVLHMPQIFISHLMAAINAVHQLQTAHSFLKWSICCFLAVVFTLGTFVLTVSVTGFFSFKRFVYHIIWTNLCELVIFCNVSLKGWSWDSFLLVYFAHEESFVINGHFFAECSLHCFINNLLSTFFLRLYWYWRYSCCGLINDKVRIEVRIRIQIL